MAAFIDKLKKSLDTFKSVRADAAEIRKCKNEIQALKEQLFDSVKTGYYLRDDRRIIISAPEVIIGNVDHSGTLIGDGGSSVIIRGNDISLHGTGSSGVGGSVVTKASKISQIAVDPGKDGIESVVWPGMSSIENKAVSISIDSENSSGVMVTGGAGHLPGVSIASETGISLEARPSNKTKTKNIDAAVNSLDASIKQYSEEIDKCSRILEDIFSQISSMATQGESLNDTETHVRTNFRDLLAMRSDFVSSESVLCSTLSRYVSLLSGKAESARQKEALTKMKSDLGKKSADFPKKTTGSSVTVASESFSFRSIDGDGNIRENPEAGFFVSAPHVFVTANDGKGALIKDSCMKVNVQKIELSTVNTKRESDGKNAKYTADGSISVSSKEVTVQAIDTELKDMKITETALAKGGSVSVRAENISALATDTDGKSSGAISLNAKNIRLASMDVDKEKRTDSQMAAGSQMVLLSENMYTGGIDKKNRSRLVQIVSDKVGIMADTTAEMQQGEAKAVVTLDGGNLTAGASKNEFNGDTTISGKADIKGEATAPKGTFKSLEASSQFKSPNISDGMGVSGGGAAGKPSAKMKIEEVKNQEQK